MNHIQENHMKIQEIYKKWPNWTITMDSGKIVKNFSKIFWILGSVTDFQIDFLNDSILFHTFCDSILIELATGFNLCRMTVLGSIGVKSYYVITKNLWRNRKFRGQKLFSENFWNMFSEHFSEFLNLRQCLSCYKRLSALLSLTIGYRWFWTFDLKTESYCIIQY